MSIADRQAYGAREGQAAWFDNKNEPHFGPIGTSISVGGQEGEFEKTTGKGLGDMYMDVVKDGNNARVEGASLAQLRVLGSQIKEMGGTAALQSYLSENWGIKVGSDISAIEAYRSITEKLVPSAHTSGLGPMTEGDAKMFRAAMPRLIVSKEGNEMIISTLEAINAYKLQRGELVADMLSDKKSPKDINAALKTLPDPFAAFKEAAKQGKLPAQTQSGGTQPAPAAAPAAPGGRPQASEGQRVWDKAGVPHIIRNGVPVKE
jgi:hypothetical protein